jgi:tetratricopeptide (TPR) repeat protein
MLGFGFKKTKVLASAEKNVKQGRLSNAVSDYERIAQEDPSDLNVLNTIGDLSVRLGNVEKATVYFKRVGDAYAAEGYTVKAIAVYKKLTKHNPNAQDAVRRLAELYTQQGMNNDARAQYMTVAEGLLRNDDKAGAAEILLKILELDPNHPPTQARLAQVYVQLGKKAEARDVFFRSAQAQRARGGLEACDAALNQVLELSPGFAPALLLRGETRLEAGDAPGAVQALESLPEIDSRPEGLQILLRAHLKLGHLTEAEPLARKLLSVFNEVSGVTLYIEALVAAGDFESALGFYQEHALTLLTANTPAVLQTLHTLIAPLKTNAHALAVLCELFEKAGDTPHAAEVTESLAHLSAQQGALPKARDLYKKLVDLEPENPLHLQNYRQVLTRLGEQPAIRERGWQEGRQARVSEELENSAPALEQNYTPELSVAIKDALTDSELFASYNLPARAIQPLEAILSRAPRHVKLNQRLASLYLRTGRLEETAQRCRVLSSVFAEAGLPAEARPYAELAEKYGGRGDQAPSAESTPALPFQHPETGSGATSLEEAARVAPPQGNFPEPMGRTTAAVEPVLPVTARMVPEPSAPLPAPPSASPQQDPAAAEASDTLAHEIDLSEEWERVLAAGHVPDEPGSPSPSALASQGAQDEKITETAGLPPATQDRRLVWTSDAPHDVPSRPDVESSGSGPGGAEEPGRAEAGASVGRAAEKPGTPSLAPIMDPALADIIEEARFYLEEARFYLSQSMVEEARMALARAEALSPAAPQIAQLRAQLATLPATDPQEAQIEILTELQPSELPADAEPDPSAAAPISSLANPEPASTPAGPEAHLEPALVTNLGQAQDAGVTAPPPGVPESVVSQDADIATGTSRQPEVHPAPLQRTAESSAGRPLAAGLDTAPTLPARDALRELVSELEASLPEDFAAPPGTAASIPQETGLTAVKPQAAGVTPEAGKVIPPAAMPPEARAPSFQIFPTDAPGTGVPETPVDGGHEFSATEPLNAAELVPNEIRDESAGLNGLFKEFKRDLESGSAESDDPETHYNLGVAFKEMGLLDEAIGEFQKVCKAIEGGVAFPQAIQVYTWLADCFVRKGLPEAGIHWYQKALEVPGLDGEGILAVHYELALAYEAAGDLPAARRHFMHVLSRNIDYRDVAQRIKSVKS